MNRTSGPRYTFRRYAGSLQVRLRTFEDLLHLPQVPEALWVATACPITGLTCDPAFLAHLDTDASGRVRALNLHRAIDWTGRMLADRSACVPGSDVLTLAHLSEEAAPLRSAAESVLTTRGAAERTQVSLAQVREVLGPSVREEEQRLVDLERLILFQRWLFRFANNFVSMPDLYSVDRPALFQQGTLILAGREFSLAVLVTDRASHAAVAAEASMFILYCAITGGQPERSFEVAVPVTAGTTRGLFVGKRGIFRDLQGREYDAQVVQIIQQPVSVYEAAVAPFRRIGRAVTSRIETWSMTADTELEQQLSAQAARVLSPRPPPPAPGKPFTQAAAVNVPGLTGPTAILVGFSVAVAALGSALAFIINQLRTITLIQLLFGLVVISVTAMIPAVLLALIRIYNRDLAVVLEGAGWAMNDRLRLTRHLGRLFTRRPRRPRGSRIDTRDQVAEALRQLLELEEGRGRARLIRLLKLLAFIAAGVLLWRYRAELAFWLERALTSRPPGSNGPRAP